MKFELTIGPEIEEVLDDITEDGDETLTSRQRFLDWLESWITQGLENRYENADIDEDIDVPTVTAKEVE
jgi:hypothetical protein